MLAEVKRTLNLPVLTDIHKSQQAAVVAEVVDVLQTPAFLCRQTDLLLAAAVAVHGTEKVINVKKGQFLAPWYKAQVVKKLRDAGVDNLWLTERGSSFGYNTLVVDYRGLPQMQELGCHVIFDATHSVQQPGGKGTSTGGQREFVAALARAAVAVGVDGLFMEVDPDPDNALSDGPNMVPLDRLQNILKQLLKIQSVLNDGPLAQVQFDSENRVWERECRVVLIIISTLVFTVRMFILSFKSQCRLSMQLDLRYHADNHSKSAKPYTSSPLL